MRIAVRQLVSKLALSPCDIDEDTFLILGLSMEYANRFASGSESLYEEWVPTALRQRPLTMEEQCALVEALLPSVQHAGRRVAALSALGLASPALAVRPLVQMLTTGVESWKSDAIHQLLNGLSQCLASRAGNPHPQVLREMKLAGLPGRLSGLSECTDDLVGNDIISLRRQLRRAGL